MQQDPQERSLAIIPEPARMPAQQGLGPFPFAEIEPEAPSMPLSHYVWVFKRHRWKMLAFVVACAAATYFVSSRITPVFESTATVDVDRQTPQGVIGQEAVRSSVNDSDQFLATQIRLIQSDSVLRPVAEKYKLLEREGQNEENLKAWREQKSGTRPEDAPVLLKNLKVARPPNTYLLMINYRSTDPQLAADAANAIANSYLEHTYNIRIRSSTSLSNFMEKQLEELRAKMERSSMALTQFERELNVINPEEKTNILSARLLQLNTEYTNAQAERVRRESVRNSVQSGTLEAAQASQQGEDLRKLSERLNEATENFAQVKAHFGANHPEYRKAAAQVAALQSSLDSTRRNIMGRVEIEHQQAVSREAMLQKTLAETKSEFDRLNSRSYEYQALKREAEADKKLYEELVRKIKEAGINAGFQNSSIRLADQARPAILPVLPNIKLNVLLALVIATLVAFGAALVGDVLDTTVRDPEQVARSLNTEVIGSLPSVKSWRGKLGPAINSASGKALVRAGGSGEQAVSGFEEAVRTLRNSILLSDVDRRMRSLLVTSASPSEGKSTTAAHLALTHAEQGRRTLLIDGDLRRPSVHRRFNIPANRGLSNVLTAECAWRELLVSPELVPDLHILPAGPPSRRASDLIGRGLEEVLTEATQEYDLVVLDAPPLLGFAEPLQMATIVDGVVVVTRAGQTSRKAVGSVLTTLRRLRANVLGVVLNEVHKEMSDSYYYYGHYSKYYAANGKG
ncbi:MAG: polysaccharide biosynthesis tyrosine autokinase [Acidimicrobiia bacterium]|nr:polysaccharide biosynthesis tyrosine autokinase [Acidimicrobiia bacterium]